MHRVDIETFEKVIGHLIKTGGGKDLIADFSGDTSFVCSVLRDIAKGKDSPNYHVLKKYTWNNEVIQQFAVNQARTILSRFSPEPEDYYRILNVSPTYSTTELRKSWLNLMKTCHPDKAGDAGLDAAKKINEAYGTLRDPMKRRDYETKRFLNALPVILDEPRWKEIASKKFISLWTKISRWKIVGKALVKVKTMNDNGKTALPSQVWLSSMIRKKLGKQDSIIPPAM